MGNGKWEMGNEADSFKLIAPRKYKNYSPQLTA
jgi:hypothetical protein